MFAVGPLSDDPSELLVERTRAGLWLVFGSVVAFGVADPFVYPDRLLPLYAIKAVQLVVVGFGFALLRRRFTRQQIIVFAIIAISIFCISTAASGIVTNDAATTPLLLVVVSMSTATLLPWGVVAQLLTQIVAAAAVLWNIEEVRGMGEFPYIPMAVIVGAFASVYASYAFDRFRNEQRRTEERRHRAELARVARLSTLGGMAAGLAHEINQPLAAIVSYARGCVRRIEAGDLQTGPLLEVIGEISAQAMRGGEVLRRIRDFVRHEDAERRPANLNELLREAVRFALPEARQLGVAVRFELASTPLVVSVDPIQIEQVILNLVRNGFEAMEATEASKRELVIKARQNGNAVAEVSIVDRGVGLAQGVAERLFEPFFTTKPEGLGLGLSISRTIVEAHGGTLWAHAGEPAGAVFSFSLPLLDEGANGRP